jgi:hypothetical protein
MINRIREWICGWLDLIPVEYHDEMMQHAYRSSLRCSARLDRPTVAGRTEIIVTGVATVDINMLDCYGQKVDFREIAAGEIRDRILHKLDAIDLGAPG